MAAECADVSQSQYSTHQGQARRYGGHRGAGAPVLPPVPPR